jgi:hypothetical protein
MPTTQNDSPTLTRCSHKPINATWNTNRCALNTRKFGRRFPTPKIRRSYILSASH